MTAKNTGKNTIERDDAFETLTLDMLPELTERFLAQATDDRLVNWALGIFGAYPHGMIHMDEPGGYLLQILHPNTIRVVQIFDNFGCFSADSPSEYHQSRTDFRQLRVLLKPPDASCHM